MAVNTTVYCSEAIEENRFSAEYFDPKYSFKPKNGSKWIKIGQALKKCQYGISISMNENGDGHPIFRMNEIKDCFVTEASKYAQISKADFNDLSLQVNDVLFNRTNSFEFVGRTGIVKKDTDSVFASYLIRIIPDSEILLPEYLTIYLNTKFEIGQIKRRAMPSINQANVSGSELKRIKILIPDISAQKKVAGLVDQSFSQKEYSLTHYEEAQKIFEQELGLDTLQFEKPLGYETNFNEVIGAAQMDAQCYKPEYVNYEKYLKQNSNYTFLKSLASSMVKGKQMSVFSSGSVSYASIKDIDGVELITDSFCFPSKETQIAKKRNLLLAITGATIGKIGIVNQYDNLAFSGDLLKLEVCSDIDPYYLLAVMQSPIGQSQCNRWITGSTNGHLAPKDVGKIVIPRLGKKKEEQIAKKIADSLRLKKESKQLLEKAKQMVEDLIEKAAGVT